MDYKKMTNAERLDYIADSFEWVLDWVNATQIDLMRTHDTKNAKKLQAIRGKMNDLTLELNDLSENLWDKEN